MTLRLYTLHLLTSA